MAYHSFRISRMPKRVRLVFDDTPNPEIVNHLEEYPIIKEDDLYPDISLGYPAEPIDDFGYQMKVDADSDWSEEVNAFIDVAPETGSPTCLAKELNVLSRTITEITSLFVFDNKSDRIRINSITGIDNNVFVQGQPIVYNQAYMIYDFKKVTVQTQFPESGLGQNTITINFTMGKKGSWGSTCNVTLDLIMYAKIRTTFVSEEETTPSFRRVANILDGIPGTQVEVLINPSQEVDNFAVEFYDENKNLKTVPLNSTGDTTVFVDITERGKAELIFTGTPVVSNQTDPYLVSVDLSLITSGGLSEFVDGSENTATLLIYNDASLVDSFNSIKNVIMDNDDMNPTADSYTFVTEAPSDIDIIADIGLHANVGKAPFVYVIEDLAGSPVTTITQDSSIDSKFEIEGMVGSSTPGTKYEFKATVTDANNVVSTHLFDFTVENVVVGSVPTITSPTDKNYTLTQSVSVFIAATNPPILSYAATGLPGGLGLNTSNGHISGIANPSGVHNVTLTATNSAGVSSDYDWEVDISGGGGSPPSITNPPSVAIYGPGYNIDYALTIDNSPTSVSVSGMPPSWYFNPTTLKIYGYMDGNNIVDVIVEAENGNGSDVQKIRFFKA